MRLAILLACALATGFGPASPGEASAPSSADICTARPAAAGTGSPAFPRP